MPETNIINQFVIIRTRISIKYIGAIGLRSQHTRANLFIKLLIGHKGKCKSKYIHKIRIKKNQRTPDPQDSCPRPLRTRKQQPKWEGGERFFDEWFRYMY
jgi:hypothetical protein